MRKPALLAILVVVSGIGPAVASEDVPDAVLATASKLIPDFRAEDARASPVEGLFELSLGPRIVYMTGDGRYLVRGDVIDLEEGENVTEVARKRSRIEAIDGLDESGMVVFAPEEIRATISVFTDITCPYCARLHGEVDALNAAGVEVRYLAYPRAGVPSSVYDDMVSVWCADDPKRAMTDAKAGRAVEPRRCDNPVGEHYAMGRRLGLNGTPTILLEDGSMLGGYVPHRELVPLAREARGKKDGS